MPEQDLDLNDVAGSIGFDEMNSQGYVKAIGELLGLGESPDAILARGRLSEAEHKASLVLLNRAHRSSIRKVKRKAKDLGVDWHGLPEQERAVRLNLALSISRDGGGRSESVSALVGQMIRSGNRTLRSMGRRRAESERLSQ